MKLINNRYKIIKRINQDKRMSIYKVEDLWNANEVAQLIILHAKGVSGELIDYYTNEFILFKNIDNQNILNDLHFNRITYINNRRDKAETFYLISEYDTDHQHISKYLHQFDFTQLIDLFVSICQVVNALHTKGFVYGNIVLGNIFYQPENNTMKLTSLANVRLQNQYSPFVDGSFLTAYSNDRQIHFKQGVKMDLHDLGVLLLHLLQGTHRISNPMKVLKQLESDMHPPIATLLPIIKALIKKPEEIKFNNTIEIINAINDALQTDYASIEKSMYGTPTFKTRLINQQTIVNAVQTSVAQIATYEETINTFLINGEIGAGKTRLLEELAFILNVQGLDVHSTTLIKTSYENNRRFLINIFRKLMHDCDVEVYEKYEHELKALFPELAEQNIDNETTTLPTAHTKYQLIERSLAFVRDSVKNRHVILLMDNIHLADEFMLDYLLQIIHILKSENAILIMTYNDQEEINDPLLFNNKMVEIKEQTTPHIFTLKNMDKADTKKLIKNTLLTSNLPNHLVHNIYTISKGNPSFIIEALKGLISRNILRTNPHDGMWEVDYLGNNPKLPLTIPVNMEGFLTEQINSLEDTMQHYIRKMSVLSVPKDSAFWQDYLSLTKSELNKTFSHLTALGILTMTYNETMILYEMNHKVLQHLLRDQLTEDDKYLFHTQAASVIEKNLHPTLFNELIYHFEAANVTEQVIKYCLMNAHEMEGMHDWSAMFHQLKKALALEPNTSRQIELNVQIAKHYLARDDKDDAYVHFKNAEALLFGNKINQQVLDINLYILKLEVYRRDKHSIQTYFDKVVNLLQGYSNHATEIEFRLVNIMKQRHDGIVDEVIVLCLALLADLTEDSDTYPESIAKAKHFLAEAYVYSGIETEKAIHLYEEAIEVFSVHGLIREQIYSVNNLAAIYLERLHEYNLAFDKFTELHAFSKAHDFASGYVLSLINIGSLYASKGDMGNSYATFIDALEKINDAPAIRNRLPFIYMNIIRIGLNMHLYSEASYYMELFQNEFSNKLLPEQEEVQLHLASSFVYYAVGVYDKSDEENDKVLNSYLDDTHPIKGYQYARRLMYQLRIKTPDAYEDDIQSLYTLLKDFSSPQYCIIILLDFALVLHEEGDYANVKRLNKDIEKLITHIEAPNDRIFTRYHYLRGVVAQSNAWEDELLRSLEYAYDEVEFSTRIMIQLAERYYQTDKLYLAINYYLEAGFKFKKLLKQVPDKYKISYVHAHQCAIAFRRLEMLKQTVIHKVPYKNTIPDSNIHLVQTIDEVKQMINNFDMVVFTNNNAFMNKVKTEYTKLTALKYHSIHDVIAHLENDAAKSIEIILSHILIKTVANRAVVLTETVDETFEVLSSSSDDVTEINTHLFQRVKTTLQPYTIYSESETADTIINKAKTSMYIPIFDNHYYTREADNSDHQVKRDMRYNIIGFLYIESEKVVNNLTIESVHAESGLLNLIALLIEKQQLKVAASIDKTTGALTRKYLEDKINAQLNESAYSNEHFSLLMIDLDRFKRINDTFGHQIGDEVLRNLSTLMMEHLGDKGVLGRFGGEEFIVILPHTDATKAMEIAEALRTLISEAKLLADDTVITVSLGVVSSTQGSTMDTLIQKADQALYEAKESGRNKALLWNKEYTNMHKKKKQTTFTSGDEVQDSRNTLALVELLQLVNKKASTAQKVSSYLNRIMKTVGAQSAFLMKISDGAISKQWMEDNYQENNQLSFHYDPQLLDATILNKEPSLIVQLSNNDPVNLHYNLPNLESCLIVPIIFENDLIGVIYLVASARSKEFEERDLHIVTVFSHIAATILRDS